MGRNGIRKASSAGALTWMDVDGRKSLVKFLPSIQKEVTPIVQFRNEYDALGTQAFDHILSIRELRLIPTGKLLVFENFVGQPINPSNPPFTLDQFYDSAIQMAQALIQTHARNLIHKNICPQSFLRDPQTGQVKLTHFGRATRLSRETQEAIAPSLLEGDLAYISPEQTGRMNRTMDYRSDLYSLGVTYYALLAGHPPFEYQDASEMVHAHIAKQAPELQQINPNVPNSLIMIIQKLMSKSAEERYQSAAGVEFDLRKSHKDWKDGSIVDFICGENDISLRFEVSQKIYGRDKERMQLLEAFERVSTGPAELFLIGGFSGIGKTSLVHEIRKPIVKRHGFFVSGKYDQYNRGIPYSAITQAFTEVIQQILVGPPSEIETWREEFQLVLNGQGRLITEIIPALELLIGVQPELPNLSPVDAQKRFIYVFKKFIHALAQQTHPLVIFLDDLQWADLPSLQLIESLLNQGEMRHLLLVTAYRNNEVNPGHPFLGMLQRCLEQGIFLDRVDLAPLTAEHLAELISDTLHLSQDNAHAFAQQLWSKTQGNAFFATQLLKSLYINGVITFDHSQHCWNWDMEKMNSVQHTDNVVDLMVQRVKTLSEQAKQFLKLAACVGNTFDLDILHTIGQRPIDVVAEALWPSLDENYIQPLGEGHQFFQSPSTHTPHNPTRALIGEQIASSAREKNLNLRYRFVHDRVQQAAYCLIPEDEQAQQHLRIGRLLLKALSPERLHDDIFEVLGHFNQGLELITDKNEALSLARLNLEAAKKAKASNAQKAAIAFYDHALQLLGPHQWNEHHELAFNLAAGKLESAYIDGNFDLGKSIAKEAITHCQTPQERNQIYNHWLQVLISEGLDFTESLSMAHEIVRALGVEIPSSENDYRQTLSQLENRLTELRGGRPIAELFNLTPMTDQQKRFDMNLWVQAWVAAYFAQDQKLLILSIYHMVINSLEHGDMDASAFGYVQFGLYSRLSGDPQSGYEWGKLAIHLNQDKYPNPVYTLRVGNIFAHAINPYFNHYKTCLPYYLKSYEVAPETGDILYGVWSAYFRLYTMQVIGSPLESIVEEHKKVTDFIHKTNDHNMILSTQTLYRSLLSLQGKTPVFGSLDGDGYNEADTLATLEKAKFQQALGWYGVITTGTKVIARTSFKEAYTCSMVSERTLPYDDGFFPIIGHFFYQSLVIHALIDEGANPIEKQAFKEILSRNEQKLTLCASTGAVNFQHRLSLLRAEKARQDGRPQQASDMYERSITQAKAGGFLQDQALALELAARHHDRIGHDRIFRALMEEAMVVYQAWGAEGKVLALKKEFPFLAISDEAEQHPWTGEHLDFAAVIKAAQAISGEIVQERLVEKIMNIALEHAGAQRGTLIMRQGMTHTIVAEADVAHTTALNIPADSYTRMPQSVFLYVYSTKKSLVVDDVCIDKRFQEDPYVLHSKVKSILCTPIMGQGRVLGYLYLENKSVAGVFTAQRLEVLELLTSQAATSLENAALYREMEKRVDERTYALNESLKKLQDAQVQLAQKSKMSALGEMAGGIAHEINNPLAIIKANISQFAELIGEKPLDVDLLIKKAATIEKTTDRIGKIVQGLRQFSRDGRLDEFEMVPVASLIEDTISFCQTRFCSMGIDLRIDPIDPALMIEVRSVEISQVVLNLLNNAHDAISKLPEKWVHIQALDTGEMIEFVITDSGPGIPFEVQKKIFQPFFTTKEVGKGTGMGLSISLGITKSNGGELNIDSECPNTRFVLRLPKKQSKHGTPGGVAA